MKNILAENMLRFGAKNLSAEQILKLTEQAKLSSEVTSHPLYNVVITKFGDRTKRYWEGNPATSGVSMTDADRIAVLNHVQKRVDQKTKIKSISQEKALKEITGVVIDPKGTTTTVTLPPPTPTPVQIPYNGTYPAVDQPNPELQNFYLVDNAIDVSPENKAKFDALVKTLLASIPNDENIVEAKISAGSSTSRVPTTYKGGDYKGNIAAGQKNNEFLAADRCAKIEEALLEVVKTNIPAVGNNIKIEQRQIAANRGTDYTEKERAYYFSTGKLDPAKKAAYDKAYGPFKGSYGSVTIITEKVQSTPSEVTPSEIVTQNWQARIVQKMSKVKPPKKLTGSPGGGQTFVGKTFSTTKCTIW
jgi:hypothetical protein